MSILSLYRSALKGEETVSTLLSGNVHIELATQEDTYPNIVIEMPEKGQDYTHSGPSGLFDAHLKFHCRAETKEASIGLGEAVEAFLEDFQAVSSGIELQLTEQFESSFDYDDKHKVFSYLVEVTAFFRRTSA